MVDEKTDTEKAGTEEAPKPAAKKKAAKKKAAAPPKREPLTDLNTTSIHDATPGGFVRVTGGEHKGRYGAFLEVRGYEKGEPTVCAIRTRDADMEILIVDYSDLEPAEAGGR